MAIVSEMVRAGILVTGTEVLSGYVTDRNGPWISERLADLGVEVVQIMVVGDRPEDLEGALRYMRDEGIDLVVTSGGLGPTADDLTAEVVGRFAGRELVLDEEMEQKIADIIARFARRLRFDPEAVREANRKQAMVPEGATAIDPAGTAPGLVVPANRQVVIVLPGPPRELQEMWPRALSAEAAQKVLGRASPYTTMSIRMFGIPESELAKSLREIEEEGVTLDQLEITTCLRGGELVTDVRHRGGAEEAAEALRAGLEHRLGPLHLQRDRRADRGGRLPAARRPDDRGRRVMQRRTARGASHPAARVLCVVRRWSGRVFERGQIRASRGRSGADRRARRRLARGR